MFNYNPPPVAMHLLSLIVFYDHVLKYCVTVTILSICIHGAISILLPPLPNVQRHEIERLTVWQNPCSQPELTVPNEEGVYSWNNPTQTDRHWRSTIAMAFNTSPHLAFQLVNRCVHGHD